MIQPLIDQLRQGNALLILGPGVMASDRLKAACDKLARLPFGRVAALGPADGLLASWQRAGRQVQLLSEDDPALRLDESRVAWLRLPETSDVVEDMEQSRLSGLLRVWCASHSACLLGCDLEQPLLRACLQDTGRAAGQNRRRHYAIAEKIDPGEQRYWAGQNLDIQAADPREWIEQALAVWEEIEKGDVRSESTAVAHLHPYQFLDFYREADAGRFFGRETAIRELGELVVANSLVVCFGPSGVGKSSLLQAGLFPQLRRQGCLPLYCRPEDDPVDSIRKAVLSALPERPIPPTPLPGNERSSPGRGDVSTPPSPGIGRGAGGEGDSLTGDIPFLLASLASQTGRSIVVVIDQGEELFTLLGEQAARGLAQSMAACLRLPGAPVRFVLALREDYLPRLAAMQAALPGIFAHRYRLRPLDCAGARQAISAPAQLCGLAYEAALLDQLLFDLGGEAEDVPPADLQIVCETLYRDLLEHGETLFCLERYQELGGAASLLGSYLESVVDGWPEPEALRAVLKAMITSQGAKIPLPAAEIARLAGLETGQAQEILEKLDRPHRLARPLEGDGERRYELAHEVLGLRIIDWMRDLQEAAAHAVHDLLRTELHNWQSSGTLPGPGKLQAVYQQRNNPYLRLATLALEMLLRAALQSGEEPVYWLERAAGAGLPAGDYLLPALSSPQDAVRRQAADLLGAPQAGAELGRLLRHPDPEMRRRAAATLGEVPGARAWRSLKPARHDRQEAVRRRAWESLEAHNAARAALLRRQDETLPLLAAGSLVYWLLVLSQLGRLALASWGIWAAIWLASTLTLWQIVPRLSGRWLAWGGALASAGLLTCLPKGDMVFLVLLLLGSELRNRPHLALAGLLGYLPLLLGLPSGAAALLWATAGGILTLAVLGLAVPRWGGYGADRPAGLLLLCAGIGSLGAAWGAASLLPSALPPGAAAASLLLGLALALGRLWARQPSTYTGGSQQPLALLVNVGRIFWDAMDEISFQIKPLLGGLVWAAWVGLLLQSTTALSPAVAPAFSIGGALWLALGAGLGLWGAASGGLLRALLQPALGAALGGWLAAGAWGAILGAGMGLGLGFGEWLGERMKRRVE